MGAELVSKKRNGCHMCMNLYIMKNSVHIPSLERGRQMGEHRIPMKFENLRHLGEIQQQQKYYISSQESQRTTEIV